MLTPELEIGVKAWLWGERKHFVAVLQTTKADHLALYHSL